MPPPIAAETLTLLALLLPELLESAPPVPAVALPPEADGDWEGERVAVAAPWLTPELDVEVEDAADAADVETAGQTCAGGGLQVCIWGGTQGRGRPASSRLHPTAPRGSQRSLH